MTSDQFYASFAKFVVEKTKIPAIWANQQARHINAGEPIPAGATAKDMRRYVLLSPVFQQPHAVHRKPDGFSPDGVQKFKDMIPMEIRMQISGMECKSDDLRPVWAELIREDFKSSWSPDWSVLWTGNLMYSPIYQKAEWKPRYVFECHALVYDWFEPVAADPIESVSAAYGIWNPSHTAVVASGTLHIGAGI